MPHINPMGGDKVDSGAMKGRGGKRGNIDTFMPGSFHSRPIKTIRKRS